MDTASSAAQAALHFARPRESGRKKTVFGSYRIDESGRLTHTSYPNGADKDPQLSVIGLRLSNGLVIGNASILPFVDGRMAYGSYQKNSRQTEVQRALEGNGVAMLPFSVFEQAGLDVSKLEVVERGGAETVTRIGRRRWDPATRAYVTPNETVHFAGASLFKIESKYFLFDVDRRELQHKIFNPFLVQLPRAAKSIAEAYRLLKPKRVVEAEAKGLQVKRQGEWFFIPTKRKPRFTKVTPLAFAAAMIGSSDWRLDQTATALSLSKTEAKRMFAKLQEAAKGVPRAGELRAGPNRPNEVDCFVEVDGVAYVKGRVRHTGREHADLILREWHVAVPNTATTSWTITGDVD